MPQTRETQGLSPAHASAGTTESRTVRLADMPRWGVQSPRQRFQQRLRYSVQRVVRRAQRLLPIQRLTAAIGVGLTLIASLLIMHRPGVYQSDTYVVLLPPKTFPYNPLLPNRSLITTAAVVAAAANSGSRAPQPTLDDIPLFSTGVTHGYLVTLPNSGSQWIPLFYAPHLHVQATGSSAAEASARLQSVLMRIDEALVDLQTKAESPPFALIRSEASSAKPSTFYVKGNRPRSGGATFLVGLGLTATITRLARHLARHVRIEQRRRQVHAVSAVVTG